jgi:hypothetical protein
MNIFNRMKNEEDGVAILFGLLMGLVGFGLAYSMMLSTITSLNVASVSMTTARLQQAAETGVNEAMTLINAGYNFKAHTISNTFTGVDRLTHQSTNVQTSNIHWEWWVTPFDLTNRSDCQQSGTSVNYNCGYYLYSKATMPDLSEAAQVTVRAILVPTPMASASKTSGGAITYTARNVSMARHGIYGLSGVSIGQGVELYTYYSVDSNAGAPLPTVSTESNNKFSVATNTSILINNTSITDARIAAYNLYRTGDFINGSPQYATCMFNGSACNSDKHNSQAYAFSFTSHDAWMADACTEYNNDFTAESTIPSGVTCLNGDITLESNVVEGNASTPSILIINGSLNFSPEAQLNLDKAPSFLQIYVNGNVGFNVKENAESKISAIIMASGNNAGEISIDPGYESSKINLYGTLVGNTITASGNVSIWQDLNTKYLKNTNDSVAYQFFSLEVTSAVRDNIPISIIGDIYGEGFIIDSGARNLEVGQ